MAYNLRLSTAAANAVAAALGEYAGSGAKIAFYTGAQNTTPETPPAGTLLATLTITGSFGSPSDGVITTSTIASASAVASGTAESFMLFKSDGTTPVCDGTVGQSGSDINFGTTPYNVFVILGTVAMSSESLTVPPH